MSTETLILIVASVLTLFGVGAFCHYFIWVQFTWPRTSGKVVGNKARSSHDTVSRPAYFPRVEFIAADGQNYEVVGDVGRPKEWPLGHIIPLRYRPSDPTHASTARAWQRLIFAGVFLGFAAASWWALLQ